MAYGDGRGERGEKFSPLHAEVGSSETERPPVATGSAESSLHCGDLQHDLHPSRGIVPAQGVMFRRCCVCKHELSSRPVAQDDDANGSWSDDYCDPCGKLALEASEPMTVPVVREVAPPADAEGDWSKTRAFLVGLGLWAMPGGFWITLFVPSALLEAFGGGR